ncbi:Uncharacterized protein PBTT_06402 [Plasmodiophora brassicae]
MESNDGAGAGGGQDATVLAKEQALLRSYLKDHPLLSAMTHDFIRSCLVERPDDVRSHARKFFSKFGNS